MKFSAQALNHLLTQNSGAEEKLKPYAGKVVEFSMTPFTTRLSITQDGRFETASTDAEPDAGITLAPSAALRLLLDPSAAASLSRISGDPELAGAVGKVLQGLRWDVEEDLSRVIGDIPAHQLTQSSLRLKEELGRQAWAVAGMVAEYWLEEEPLIAKRRHLEQFSREVDTLRDDVERFAKRLEKLEQGR